MFNKVLGLTEQYSTGASLKLQTGHACTFVGHCSNLSTVCLFKFMHSSLAQSRSWGRHRRPHKGDKVPWRNVSKRWTHVHGPVNSIRLDRNLCPHVPRGRQLYVNKNSSWWIFYDTVRSNEREIICRETTQFTSSVHFHHLINYSTFNNIKSVNNGKKKMAQSLSHLQHSQNTNFLFNEMD